MKELYHRFYIYARSAFGKKEKKALYEFIWKQYSKRVTFYIGNFIHPSHDFFDDVFQEVMLKIYNHLHTFNPKNSFKAWVYKICRNQCLDFIKSKEEKIKNLTQQEHPDIPADHNPETYTIKEDLLKKIHGYIDSLQPGEKEIAYLRFYEGLKYKDIAHITGKNISTIKAKIRSIKMQLSWELRR